MVDGIEQMSGADVCYVPYWLDSDHLYTARVCFPSKIASYLAAGRPLFVHAPTDSSPALFARRHKVGLTCDSLDADRIIASLDAFVSDRQAYSELARGCTAAIEAELSLKVFHASFADLMGVDVRDLTPVGAVRVGDFV